MRSIIFPLLSLLLVFSCNTYDENERFDGPLIVNAAKHILIEDFTGQKCTNCPQAAQRIKNIQTTYGEENVIAVAIYTDGAFGIHEKDGGLANDEGLAILNEAGVKSFPNGRVDRTGLQNPALWTNLAKERLELEATANVSIENLTIDNENGTISTNIKIKAGSPLIKAKLEVWITEDGIIGQQSLPSGGSKDDYEHNHVFRAKMTDPVAINLNEFPLEQDFQFSKPIKNGWNADKLNVVAILSSGDGTVINVLSKSTNNSAHKK